MRTRLSPSALSLLIPCVAISAIAVACTGHDTTSPVTPSSASSLSANPSSSTGNSTIGTNSHGGGSGGGSGSGSGSGGSGSGGSGGTGSGSGGGSGSGNSGSGNGGNGGDNHGGPGHGDDNEPQNEVELTGTVSARTGACPTLTFSIGSTTFMTSTATVFRDPCADVVKGAVVEVKGTRQTNGTVLATRVHVEDREDENEDENENEVELTGTIAGKTGTCPTLTFSIGTTTFRTNAQTLFREACNALVNGNRVEVKGTREANGTVLASRVHVED